MFFFFFFKQKTAYEMVMSDWSSDVCSSDLAVQAGEEEEPAGVSGPRARRRGFQMLRLDSSHAQRGECARQRRGDRSARHVGGNERRRVLLEEAGGKEGVVAGVPGLQAAAEQRRLGHGAGEVEHLEGVE